MKNYEWIIIFLLLIITLFSIGTYIKCSPSKPTFKETIKNNDPWLKIKTILDTTSFKSDLWPKIRYMSDVQQCSIFVSCDKPVKFNKDND